MASMDGKLLSIFLFKNFGISWLLQASLIDWHFQVSASRLSNIHRELTVQHQKDFWHLPEQSCHVRERSLRWGGLTHPTGAKGIARGIAALLENLAGTKRTKPWSLRRKPGSWDSHPVHNGCICCMQSYLPKKTLCQHAASSLPVWQCQASKTTKININDTSQVQCTENKTKRKQMSCRIESLDKLTVLRIKTCRGFLVPLACFELRPESKLKQQQQGMYRCICLQFEVGQVCWQVNCCKTN